MQEFLLPVAAGAAIGFVIGMLVGGRIAGGKVVDIKPPYAYVEGGTPGCAGVLKQLGIALLGTMLGALLGALVAAL